MTGSRSSRCRSRAGRRRGPGSTGSLRRCTRATRSGHRPASRSPRRASTMPRRASPGCTRSSCCDPAVRSPGRQGSSTRGARASEPAPRRAGSGSLSASRGRRRRTAGDRGLPELAAGAGVQRGGGPANVRVDVGSPRGWLRPAAGHPHPAQPALVRRTALRLWILETSWMVALEFTRERVPRFLGFPDSQVQVRPVDTGRTPRGARDDPPVPGGHLRRQPGSPRPNARADAATCGQARGGPGPGPRDDRRGPAGRDDRCPDLPVRRVATASAGRRPRSCAPPQIGVAPGWRGRGVAVAMGRALTGVLLRKGYQTLEASWVRRDNRRPQVWRARWALDRPGGSHSSAGTPRTPGAELSVDTGYAAALPLALGAAVSPGLLAIVLLILLSETRPEDSRVVVPTWCGDGHPRRLLRGTRCDSLTRRHVRNAVNEVVCRPEDGTTLILFGLGWRSMRPSQTRSADRRPWIEARLKAARPPVFFIVGVATMLTNWSTLLLYLSALEVIRARDRQHGHDASGLWPRASHHHRPAAAARAGRHRGGPPF
jgi:GNAT superfamily N-acetyltransferase